MNLGGRSCVPAWAKRAKLNLKKEKKDVNSAEKVTRDNMVKIRDGLIGRLEQRTFITEQKIV